MAQRRLAEGSSDLGRVFERLSSGQRINRASDDAAGLAIADGLRVRSRLYGGAIRNINDALSLLNIADSTLGDQSSILMRLKELAEQSANGVFSAAQRETMNREYFALVREFGRLGDTASFNGLSLLRTRGATTNVQAGIDGSVSSRISFENGVTGTLSGVHDLDANPDPSNFTSNGTLAEVAASYGNHLYRTIFTDGSGAQHEVLIALRHAGNDPGYTDQVRIDMFARSSEVGDIGSANVIGDAIGADDEWSLAGRMNLTFDRDSGKVLSPQQDLSYKFKDSNGTMAAPFDFSQLIVRFASESGQQQSTIDFTGIENVGRARDALDILSRRLEDLVSLRGTYGATQSRLNSALSLLESSREAVQGAESRIRDIDVAAESARLVALQIRQQAAATVLSSANLQPQLMLNLLRSG